MSEYTTKVITYHDEKAMRRGIRKMEKAGWEVVSVNAIERGRGFVKGCLFGLFAFLMKPPHDYQVTFHKAKS